MNNNYENKILDAIQTLVDNAVTKAGYDKTIKAVISKCVNESTGKYVVRYQDSSFYAYSNDLDSIYSGGTPVYVLVPGNDMSQTKTILGSVDKLGTEYITLSESNAAYQEVGTSVITPNGAIPGISSYKADGDSLVIYDRTSSNNLVNVDLEGIELYFQQSNYMEIGGTFTTRLLEEQKRKGNYGLVFDMDFYNGEEIVNKQYVLDINSMTGNPYSYNLGSEQNVIFEIDGVNFYRLNSITLECKNFPKSATPYTNDIFVEDVVLKALTPLTRDELANNSLTFTTKQGIYFNENDSASATRLIETEVKINKKVVPNTGGLLRFYWFKEDSTIGITSADYLPFGGPGWRCLNQYNIIDETNNIRDYITDVDTLTVVKSENPAKENEYKCVVIYNNEIQVERNIIIYNTTSEYTITIESDQGNYFKYNEGNPTLTCSVNPAGTYTYIWTETNSANKTEVLSETSNSYSVQLGTIANFSKFTCSVFSNGNFLGKSNIVITNSWDPEDNSYAIIMENGDQIFKYNEKGIAPTNKSLEKPIVLKPLQFTIYDEFGHEVDDNKISATDVSWYVPKEDTMIKVTTTGITPIEEDGYLIYSGVKTLNFEIASVYNNKKMNNVIKLNVRYNDRVLNTTSELEFLKEGEIGSNGTDFVCRIVPNVAANAQVPNYPIYTYNTTTSTGAMNYQLAANNKWFKVQLYKDGVQIYEGVASGTSEESKAVTVAWSMLTNKYSSIVSDATSFNVNSSTGEFSYVNLSDTNLDRAANIAKVTVTYDGATYYATMPIILVRVSNASYKLDLENNTGFRYVMYTTDGLNPVYDSSNPFALIAYNGTTDITNNDNITFTYSTLGQIYNGTAWINENNFIAKAHGASNPLAKNEADYRPIEKFDGLSVNNAVKCIVKESGSEKVRIYLPIHFYLNRFGNAALNGWDGNHVEINQNGGFILAPQIGAGKKEQDNSYTGVFMGTVRESGSSNEEVGLFGYNYGERTLTLDATDGSAKFGKQGQGQIVIDPGANTARLYSDDYEPNYVKPSEMTPPQTKYLGGYSYWRKTGNDYRLLKSGVDYTIGQSIAATDYVWANGTGLEIDLNDPHIRFGSGKFRVDNDGQVYATGFVSVAELEDGAYNIPSGSIDVGSGDSLNDYIYNTDVTLNNLQSQIDGAIQFWNGEAIPTLNNYPANEWTTEEERTNHQADIYTVIYDEDGEWKQGKSYRFDKVNGTWMWIELTDNEMSAVQALAASKAKVFVATPYAPYSVGDLWLKDGKDLYKCKTAKDSGGSYSTSDWELATDYTNDDRADAAYSKAEDAETAIQTTVRQVDVEYGVSTSSTTAPTSWSTASPTWEEDKFVWSRQKVTYVNGTTATRNEVCIQGAKGEDGTSGKPGTNGANTATIYLYKRSASAPTSSMPYSGNVTYTFANQSLNPTPSNSWTTSIPTGTNPLYVTIAVAYSNTATDTIAVNEWSTPVKFVENGAKGQDGRGIASTEVKYVADNQGTTPPADSASWSTNPPSGDNKGKFIWTRTRITYTDSQNPTTSYSVSYEGTNGINGNSITITSQAIEYAVGENGTSHPTSEWSTTIPSVPDTKYLWTRTTVNYSDNTTTVSYSASYQSKDGVNGTSATNVVCGNEAQIISCDKDGKVTAQTDITIPFAGYLGNTRKACSVTPTGLPDGMTIQSNTAATTSADGSLVLRVAANSTLGGTTAGTVTLTFGCNSLSFVKKFAWSKAIKGADGANGKSIVVDTTTITYQNSTSGTTKPTGTWTSGPSPEEGKYTWTKTVTTYKLDGTSTSAGSSTSYSVAYTGPKGDQGRSLVKQTPLHYLKSNDTAPAAPTSHVTSTSTAAGVWTTAMPEYIDGYMYFTCSENEFNEAPLYEWTNVVKDNGLNDALTIANQAKESVDNLLEDIDSPTNEKTGKYIDIDDALPVPMIDFSLYGETQQDSTTQGKNLLPNNGNSQTSSGITFTKNEDGSVKVSGTASANVDYYLVGTSNQYEDLKLLTTTYTLSGCSGGSGSTYMLYLVLNRNGSLYYYQNFDSARNVIVESGDRFRIFIRVISGTTLNTTIYPMLEKGSTATTYEPFVPNSPSPDYPQDIHCVSGDNTIKVVGKNLFDAQIMAGTYSNATYTIASDGLITQSDTDNSAWNINQNRVFYLSAGTYTIRIWGTRRYLQVRNLTDNSDLLVTPNDSATFTLNDRKAVAIKTYGTASGLTYPVSYYIQIEKGSTSSEYEAYKEQSQLISLPVENLFDYTKISSVSNGTNSNGIITSTTNSSAGTKNVVIGFSNRKVSVEANTTMYFSVDIKLNSNSTGSFNIINDNVNGGATKILQPTLSTTYQRYQTSFKYTSATQIKALLIQITNLVGSVEISNIMISTSSSNSYTPYGTTPIELLKIGNYKDYIYRQDNRWYLHKEIGKVVLDGSETGWYYDSTYQRVNLALDDYMNDLTVRQASLCNNFIYGNTTNTNNTFQLASSRVLFKSNDTTSKNNWTTWLSTHNTIVYYVLSTPTDTEITDTILLEQLNNLMTLPLFENINHITDETFNSQPDLYIKYYRNTTLNQNFASKGDVENAQQTADAAYAQAQSTLITYTITDTANEPGDSATWSNVLPSAPDKYIWQRVEYKFLDSSKDYTSQPSCIYTPTRITNELQYCLCSQNNYDETKITDSWQSEPFPWNDSYATIASPTEIQITRYQFVRNKYNDTNKTEDAITYSDPILDQAWYMFGRQLASEKASRQILENNINNSIVTINNQDGVTISSADSTYGIRLTSVGLRFLINGAWTTVWNIDGTLDANLITVKDLRADNILSGTLTLSTTDNNGSFILNSTYGESTRVDGSGVKVTTSDGATVHIKTGGGEGISAKTQTNVEYFNVDPDTQKTTMTNSAITNECAFGTHIKVVQITNGIAFIGI